MNVSPGVEDLKSVLERLASQPRALFEICSGAGRARLAQPVAPGKWSPLQIIQHLTGCDREALLPRIEKMLAEDHPFLPAYDQDRWMAQHGAVHDHQAVVLINEFARLREKSVILLFDLSREEWLRTGHHEERGQITLYDLAVHFAAHDESHRRQIAQHLARDSKLNTGL